MKRSVLMAALAAMCLLVGWMAGSWRPARGTGVRLTSSHTGISVEQVQALATLVTMRVDVADVQETRLEGHTGSIKVALLVKGDLLLGTDLSRGRLESVDTLARTAVLVLPPPHIASTRLDHERTRIFAVAETGLWLITPGDNRTSAAVIERAYRQAERYVAEAGDDPALLSRSRGQAEAVLATFFRATGWQIAVQWEE